MQLLKDSGPTIKAALSTLSGPNRLGIDAVHNLQETLEAKQTLNPVLSQTTAAYTTEQANKLAGIAAGATANASNTVLLSRANHTGTQDISTVAGLQMSLDSKQPLSSVLTNTTASYTLADASKLAGIATGATANSPNATLLARANHTGTQAISTVTNLQSSLDAKQPLSAVLTNTTASFTTADSSKLAGIATGATVNSPDATLLSRANHTGTQATSTITGLDSALAGKQPLTTVLTNTTASFTTALNTKLTGIATGATNNGTTASLLTRANHTGTQAISTIDNLQTSLDGKISGDGSVQATVALTQAAYDALPVKVATTQYIIIG